jgi:uncharacterized protein (DUF927 family)
MKIIVEHSFQPISNALNITKYNILHNRVNTETSIRGVRQYGEQIYLVPHEGDLILIDPEDEISYNTED